ncbi:MAG: hypothetical protein HYR60_03505 [Acidobacteria bacterium]|nr:hypothetical protein [Acidobacteriota bacterium]MBI3473955.1 hypothetical protein [Candidatus Solibacter usitatus]
MKTPSGAVPSRVALESLAGQVRAEMIPLGASFSYFSLTPLAEEDLKQFLEDPIAALPPAIRGGLPRIEIILAPYLEKGNGKTGDLVCFDKPQENRQVFVSRLGPPEPVTLAFAVKDEDMADYHYSFYNAIASLVAAQQNTEAQQSYYGRLREELAAEVHGEVDERSWHLKQALLRRAAKVRKETRPFLDYARQSFEDTLTLYLHGICCDIDVETGPRQMPSRYLRKRLELLMSLYPPPEGFAVLPEHVTRR